jgi:hypothetical protein
MLLHEAEPFMPEKKPMLPEDVIHKIAKGIESQAPSTRPAVEGETQQERSKLT